MKVLVACEFSGIVRDAFTSLGHDAWSCDILPTESDGPHIQDNVLNHLSNEWDLLIAHPPCTYLCNSGVRWLYNKDHTINSDRWEKMDQASLFFSQFLDCKIKYKCIENPIMHKYARANIKQPYSQIIQPYHFGHGETKATALWLDNLPLLTHTNVVSGRVPRIHKLPPSSNRGKLRSITYAGIAKAMAIQWTTYIENNQHIS